MFCEACGRALRTNNRLGYCLPCRDKSPLRQAQKLAWRKAHPERVRAHAAKSYVARSDAICDQQAGYYKANREKVRAAHAEYYKANREKTYARQTRYRKENPEKFAAKDQRRRALEAGTGGAYTTEEWLNLLERFAHTCPACGDCESKLTVDHIVPLSCGGSSNIGNLQPLCSRCNKKKHTKTVAYSPRKISVGSGD